MPDIHGRPYAKLSELRPGTKLEADDGFDCMICGQQLEVKAHPDGTLFIECDSEGGHTLDGQLAGENGDGHDPDELIGLYRVQED